MANLNKARYLVIEIYDNVLLLRKKSTLCFKIIVDKRFFIYGKEFPRAKFLCIGI